MAHRAEDILLASNSSTTAGGFSLERWLKVVLLPHFTNAFRARRYVTYERCANLSEKDVHAVVDNHPYAWVLWDRIKELKRLSEEDTAEILWSQNMSLFLACCRGDVKRTQQLITKGADLNWRNPLISKNTPVFTAATHGYVDLLNMLIKKGGDVSICDLYKQSPVWWAALHGHVGTLSVLMRAKADVNAANLDKRTPVWVAARNGHVGALNVLIRAKADVNAADVNLDTPAHIAAYNGHVDILRTLHQHNAKLNTKNKENKTPLDMAVQRKRSSVVKFLKTVGEEQHTSPPDSNTTPDLSVDDDTAHEVLEQEVSVSTADLMLAGSPGSGKTSVMYLSLNEPPPAPDVRNSTGVETPVRAIASGIIYADGTMMKKLETEEMLDMACRAMRHAIEKNIKRDYEEHVNTQIHRPDSFTPIPTPIRACLEDLPRQADNAPKQRVSTPEASATTEEEKLKVFAKLMKEVSSVKASPDFLSATLVSTTDSGGQPQFMDACSLLLRSNSLFMITVKLNEKLDDEPKFEFFINGKPISMCSTSLQLTNLQLIESIAKTMSSIQLSTVNATEDGSEPRQAKFMLVGTFADKAHECEGETIADKNRILKERLKHFKAQLVDNGGDVIFPVNAVTTDPDERQKAALRLQQIITNTPGTSVKANIKLRWFGLLMHMLDVAKKKGVSILQLDEIIAAGKCLMMSEKETREAVKCFHDMNLVNHHSTEKLDQLVFVYVKPILDQLTNLIGVAFIDKHMLDEIFKPKVLLAYDQEMLRDYGRFSQSLLESCFSLPAPLTAEVFLDVLEHLSMIARIEKDGQTSFYIPCALPYAPEDVVIKKEQVSVTPWILRLKMRCGAVLVDIPVPKGYLPTLIIRLITSRKFEADLDSRQYRNVMSICYVDGGHVYFIERSHQLEIYYSWDEESPEQCSVICSEIMSALVEAEEKLHFKPDILTKEDVFICSCNWSHPRHFCAYNRQTQKAMCEMSKKPCYLSKQQQCWIPPPSPVLSPAETGSRSEEWSNVSDALLEKDDISELCDVLTPIEAKWDCFATQLGILPDTTDAIGRKHHHVPTLCLKDVLNTWLKGEYNKAIHGQQSWRRVCEATASPAGGGNKRLAQEIAAQHNQSKPKQTAAIPKRRIETEDDDIVACSRSADPVLPSIPQGVVSASRRQRHKCEVV